MAKHPILDAIILGTILSAVGISIIKSFNESYYNSKPGIVYMVNGKEMMERRFDTNEECREYMNSERGKQEAAYYSSLNKKK
jgi:hypothetical protein